MLTYKLQNNSNGQPCAVLRSDGWTIPFAQDNTDYIAYLKWVAEGNTPESADA